MGVITETNDKIYNLTVKLKNNRDVIIQAKTKWSLRDLKSDIHRHIRNIMWTEDNIWKNWSFERLYSGTLLILNGASRENALITDKYTMSTTLDNIIGLTDGSVLTAVPLVPFEPKRKRSLLLDYTSAASDYIMTALGSIGRHNDKIYNLTVKLQNNRDIIIQAKTKWSLRDLKSDIHRHIRNIMWTEDNIWKNWSFERLYSGTLLILNGASRENALITDKYTMSTTLDNIIGLTDGSVLTAVPLVPFEPKRKRSLLLDYTSAASDYIMTALASIGRHNDNSPADSNDDFGGKLKGDPTKPHRFNQKSLKTARPPLFFQNSLFPSQKLEQFQQPMIDEDQSNADHSEDMQSNVTERDSSKSHYFYGPRKGFFITKSTIIF